MIFSPMSVSDLEEIARIHKAAFSKDHFTYHLTFNLLEKFYETLLKQNRFCFVAKTDDQIAGFIISGEHTSKAVKDFTNNNFFSVLGILLLHPKFLIQKLKMMLNRDTFRSSATTRLLSISINPKMQSKGVGRFMIESFEKEVKKEGCKLYGLSVRKSNQYAIDFYHRNNFNLERETLDSFYFIKNL